jgi:hypothetical protein
LTQKAEPRRLRWYEVAVSWSLYPCFELSLSIDFHGTSIFSRIQYDLKTHASGDAGDEAA